MIRAAPEALAWPWGGVLWSRALVLGSAPWPQPASQGALRASARSTLGPAPRRGISGEGHTPGATNWRAYPVVTSLFLGSVVACSARAVWFDLRLAIDLYRKEHVGGKATAYRLLSAAAAFTEASGRSNSADARSLLDGPVEREGRNAKVPQQLGEEEGFRSPDRAQRGKLTTLRRVMLTTIRDRTTLTTRHPRAAWGF